MFEKEAKERAKDIYIHHFDDDVNYPDVLKAITVGVQKGAEHGYNKANEELEEKISILLSCKNCPENKDGLICQKEYENKCLAQKIQYIKELKEENKVLAQNLEDTEILNKTYEKRFSDLEKENAELKKQLEMSNKVYNDNLDYSHNIEGQLTKAKEIIEELYNIIPASMADYAKEPMEHARKFLTEEADE